MLGPVKNQHINNTPCGCCWAFAATGVVEATVALATGKPAPSLSEQALISCDRGPPFDDLGCQGGSVEGAVHYIRRNGGLPSEDDYPYTGKDDACRHRRESHVVARVGRYVKVRRRSDAALAAAVARVGPVAVGVCCGDYIDDWHAYTGEGDGVMRFNGSEVSSRGRERERGRVMETRGRPPHPSSLLPHALQIGCSKPLDHAVVVVGYTPTEWLLKNSWGDAWGDGGFFKLRRGVPLGVAPKGAAGVLAMPGYPLPAKREEEGGGGVEVW